MRNLILLILLIVGLWFYLHPSEIETKPEPTPAPVAVVPPPTPQPRLYYHSPLDAPPMSTSGHTEMGYYSTDPNSDFGTGARINGSQTSTRGHGTH